MPSPTAQALFQKTDIGALSQLQQFEFNAHFLPEPFKGKVFLKELLGLSSMEVSINHLPVGGGMPFWHKHTHNEELYIFLSGKGQMMIDDACFDVQEGSIISVKPDAKRVWRNTSEIEALVYVIIQATENSMLAAATEDGVGVKAPVIWPK